MKYREILENTAFEAACIIAKGNGQEPQRGTGASLFVLYLVKGHQAKEQQICVNG